MCSMYTRIDGIVAQPMGPVKGSAVARATVDARIHSVMRPLSDVMILYDRRRAHAPTPAARRDRCALPTESGAVM